ncbi:hypothetical protein TSAR_003109 [Trichomalopsis sarcophagae]|uniref:Uncharacterized protein n=1 Tax=Trichomalopsis sarcophagae TaxID=543379 RepID=A0A232EJK4_9HYME|nr:hypothetical protein TSAR_003109 [Trichomalopsis sarcophagae]
MPQQGNLSGIQVFHISYKNVLSPQFSKNPCVSKCAKVCQSVPECAKVYQSMPKCNKFPNLNTLEHYGTLWHTLAHNPFPLGTETHSHESVSLLHSVHNFRFANHIISF